MTGKSDDELARTATAVGAPSAPAGLAAPVGQTLGRYRLERELGAGGMGVVHAAFDPDLERRVALKVLRSADAGDDGRQRLLREARAMARLTHPNVVVVHEVGSVGGRDYVAMELIDGATLDDWQRAERRKREDVFTAYLAAGRGLAAAHTAGLVHRDFKPHNVLRGKDGRVVVTDFGLARGVDAPPDPMAATQDLAPSEAGSSTPSSLSGLTRTGSVLGTPAYMSPEQWRGETGPASDQFAFCVALWEALAGRRPFRGKTAEALRAEVEAGPSEGELGALPRRVRATLRRGLDPDPARRWPTMDALLARLVADDRRVRLAWQVVGYGTLAVALFFAISVLTYHHAPADELAAAPPAAATCPPPPIDPATIAVGSGQAQAAAQIARDVAAWQAARQSACAAGLAAAPRVACLDAVAARLAAVAQVVASLPAGDLADAGEQLVAPAVCAAPNVPRLTVPSPQLREVIGEELREHASSKPADVAALHALLDRVAADPCASALAAQLAALGEDAMGARAAMAERALTDSERCTDDRVRAELAITRAMVVFSTALLDVNTRAKLQVAEAAVARVAQPDLAGDLAVLRAQFAKRNDQIDDAIVQYDAAAVAYAARGRITEQVDQAMEAALMRAARGQAEDIAALPARLAELRTLAVGTFGAASPLARHVDHAIALEQRASGDVAGAHALLESVWVQRPQAHPRRVTGHVVDEHGAAVAGATVTVSSMLWGDSISAAMAFPVPAAMRRAQTDASGAFAFADAPSDGAIVAESGALRSWGEAITDEIKLVVLPTSRVTGHVALSDVAARNANVIVTSGVHGSRRLYLLTAPVARDGAFDVSGVPRGPATFSVYANDVHGTRTASVPLQVDKPVLGGVELTVPAGKRVVTLVIGSTISGGPGNAQVILMHGKQPAEISAAALLHDPKNLQSSLFGSAIDGEHAPHAVLAIAHPGDLYVTLYNVPDGDVSACALGLPKEIDAEEQRKLNRSYDKLMLRCVVIPPGAEIVAVDALPWPKL